MPLSENQVTIREMVRTAPLGSVLVLASLDHTELVEGLRANTRDSGDPITLLSIDDGVDYVLERWGCRFVSLRQLLPSDAYADIDRLAEEMGGRWNLLDGQDVTEFEGVSYASLVQWEMTYLFARVMKSVVDARAVAAAVLGDMFLIPVRPGPDPMIPYGHLEIMGDQPELLFAEALSYIGGAQVRVRRVALRGAPGRRPDGPRWRIRLSQAIQRWIVGAILPSVRGRRLFIQNEDYLGPELIRTLATSGRYRLIVDAPGGLRLCLRALRGQDSLHIPHTWFAQRTARRALRRAAAFFRGDGRDCVTRLQSKGSLRFRDVNLDPLVREKLRFLFSRRFPELAAQHAQVCAWLKTTGIHANVLVENTMQLSRQFLAASQRLGVKSLCVQHGATGYHDIGLRIGFIPTVADVMAVWGEISRTWMERAGVPARKLAVVGPARFDCYPQAGRPPVSARERAEFCARVGISPADRLILYAESPAQPYLFPNKHYTFRNTRTNLKILLEAMRRLPGFRLGIRLKNGIYDPYALLYRDLVDHEALDNIIFLPESPIGEQLLHSEFTVASYSGVAIEALYYEHPVIVVDLTGYHQSIPIVEYGAGILATSPEEFVEFIRRYDNDPALRDELQRGRERVLREYIVARDGAASRRVVALLDALIEQGPAAACGAIAANAHAATATRPRLPSAAPAGSDG